MSSLISGRHIGVHAYGHQHGVFILSSINMREMFWQVPQQQYAFRPETWRCCLFNNLNICKYQLLSLNGFEFIFWLELQWKRAINLSQQNMKIIVVLLFQHKSLYTQFSIGYVLNGQYSYAKNWITWCLLLLRILNFDWLAGNCIWARIPLTTNMLGVRLFFAMNVADFEIFLWVFLIKELFHSRLLKWDGR